MAYVMVLGLYPQCAQVPAGGYFPASTIPSSTPANRASRTAKRDTLATNDFITDLRSRVVGRPQISTDGFQSYPAAIYAAFGQDCDYAQIIKEYGVPDDDDHKYSPSKCIGAKRIPLIGKGRFPPAGTCPHCGQTAPAANAPI